MMNYEDYEDYEDFDDLETEQEMNEDGENVEYMSLPNFATNSDLKSYSELARKIAPIKKDNEDYTEQEQERLEEFEQWRVSISTEDKFGIIRSMHPELLGNTSDTDDLEVVEILKAYYSYAVKGNTAKGGVIPAKASLAKFNTVKANANKKALKENSGIDIEKAKKAQDYDRKRVEKLTENRNKALVEREELKKKIKNKPAKSKAKFAKEKARIEYLNTLIREQKANIKRLSK